MVTLLNVSTLFWYSLCLQSALGCKVQRPLVDIFKDFYAWINHHLTMLLQKLGPYNVYLLVSLVAG